MGKVDVIIPTYNRSEFLRAAIGSVLNQSFDDLTLMVVDDARR
jgi:glycosyltransferase involved in cell wall biosynthesis